MPCGYTVHPASGNTLSQSTHMPPLRTRAPSHKPAPHAPSSKTLTAHMPIATHGRLNLDGTELNLAQLRGTEPVVRLDLSDQELGVASGHVIARQLESHRELTALDIGFNYLDEPVSLAIVRSATQHQTVTSLGLARCEIGPSGAAQLAECVRASRVLRELVISHNEIEDEGAIALSESLQISTSLEVCAVGLATVLNVTRHISPPCTHIPWPAQHTGASHLPPLPLPSVDHQPFDTALYPRTPNPRPRPRILCLLPHSCASRAAMPSRTPHPLHAPPSDS